LDNNHRILQASEDLEEETHQLIKEHLEASALLPKQQLKLTNLE